MSDINPLVSVIIPTFARPINLCRAIESVLAQTYHPIEIIVVDDNGNNSQYQIETEQLLQPYLINKKIIYVKHEKNKNGSAARNTGLALSKGAFINFLDDDDILFPDKIKLQVERLTSLPEKYGATTCHLNICSKRKEQHLFVTKEGNLSSELLTGKQRFNTTTLLFRREVLEKLNGFDESFIRHQDWELMIRFFRNYLLAVTGTKPLINKFAVGNPSLKSGNWIIPVKEKFLSTFKDDIDKMDNHGEIYYCQYMQVVKLLLTSGEIKNAIVYLNKAREYRKISLTSLSELLLHYLKARISSLISRIYS